MDIRTYQARSLQEALAMVRRDLGPEASILETRSGPRGFFRWFRRSTTVQVVASNTIHVPSRLADPGSGCQPDQERVVTHSEQPVMLDEGPSLVADLCQEHATSSGLGNSELACQLMHGISQQGIPNQEFQELLQQIDPLDQDAENLSVMYQRLADQLARTIRVGGTIQPGQGGQTTVATVGPSGTGKTINLAKLAAQLTGCPPKVVICPSLGSKLRRFMNSQEEIKAPIGIPPPIPFAMHKMSGITSYLSNPNRVPNLPKQVCISSKIKSVPV